MIETSTIIEALYYLLRKLKKADKINLIKLIYLADKYHLICYGRTITNDDYYAMEHGPVGITVKDVLSFDTFNISLKTFKYLSTLIIKIDENHFRVNPDVKVTFDMLSDTDKKVLDFIIEKFGNKSSWQLRDYIHQYPEWYQYEDMLKSRLTKRERIDTKELLSTIKNDLLNMPRKHTKESGKILTGKFV